MQLRCDRFCEMRASSPSSDRRLPIDSTGSISPKSRRSSDRQFQAAAMCGIIGAYDYRRTGWTVDRTVFAAMVDALAHRGPDGRGVWFDEGIALGHRRLAI